MSSPAVLRHATVNNPLTCSVCLEDVSEGFTHETTERITHLFHEACIRELSTCPNCRTPISMPLVEHVNDSRSSSLEDEELFNRYLAGYDARSQLHPTILRNLCHHDLELNSFTRITHLPNGDVQRFWNKNGSQFYLLTGSDGNHKGYKHIYGGRLSGGVSSLGHYVMNPTH